MSGFIKELCDGLLAELAEISAPAAPEPAPAPVTDSDRYCGRYELRTKVAEVTGDESGRLWLTQEERNEAAAMAARAGEPVEPSVTELRRIDGEVFVRAHPDGRRGGLVEFIDSDDSGRARFLHDGRVAPRVAIA